MRLTRYMLLMVFTVLLFGCAAPSIKLISDAADPLREFTLSGEGADKILVIPIRGIISDKPRSGLVRVLPGKVQEVVAHLKKAEKDADIKAVLLKIDSPGGTATASDILYQEITAYKKRTGVRMVAMLMNIAASGGYYVALPADRIIAHPTTITGSVGAVLMRPRLDGLMAKVGVSVAVSKSGENKDMGSPFRPATEKEKAILQETIEGMGDRFMDRVRAHRPLTESGAAEIATARIFGADQAKAVGLIDDIGYLDTAIDTARKLAGLESDSRVVIYRRTRFPDDNIYNPLSTRVPERLPALIDVGIGEWLPELTPGVYYLWPGALGMD